MHPLLIVLISIGALLLLLLLLLLFGTARVRLTYTGKKPRVVVSVLGIRFTILSDKDPDEAKTDLSRCRNPKRVLKRELKRQKKLAAKAEKKKRKAAQKAAEKAKKKREKKALAATQPAPNLNENLNMILALLKKLYALTHGKMKVRVKRLMISVATDDAAKTAILYGTVVASVSAIIEFIDRKFTRIHRRSGEMQVRADYLSEKTKAEIDIVCSIRLYRAFHIAISMLLAWRTERSVAVKKARARVEAAIES